MSEITEELLNNILKQIEASRKWKNDELDTFEATINELKDCRKQLAAKDVQLKVAIEALKAIPHHIDCASRYLFDLTKPTGKPCNCYKSKATEALKAMGVGE